MSIRQAMNKMISLIWTVNDCKGRPPVYVNTYTLASVIQRMLQQGVPVGYVDNLIGFYRELRR